MWETAKSLLREFWWIIAAIVSLGVYRDRSRRETELRGEVTDAREDADLERARTDSSLRANRPWLDRLRDAMRRTK